MRLDGTNEEQQKKDHIWKFVLEHQELFCDPPPEGLGFPRPGMIPGHYLKRPEEWALDQIRVQKLKRERQLRDGTANRTVSTGMAPGTRQLLDDIRRLAREGHAPADISAQLGRHGGRRTQRPGPGAGSLRPRRPGTHPTCRSSRHSRRPGAGPGQEGTPMETGETGKPGTENRRVLFEVEVLGRSQERRCFVCASPAWPMHTVRPGAATTAATPASPTCPRSWSPGTTTREDREVREDDALRRKTVTPQHRGRGGPDRFAADRRRVHCPHRAGAPARGLLPGAEPAVLRRRDGPLPPGPGHRPDHPCQ